MGPLGTSAGLSYRSKEDVAAELEHRVRSTSYYFNKRDWQALKEFPGVAPNFVGYLDRVQGDLTWEGMFAAQLAYVQKDPGYCIHIVRSNVYFDDAGNNATVYALVHMSGRPDEVLGEHVFVMHFYRTGDEWLWSRHTSVRGTMMLGAMDSYRAADGSG